ncbi:RNA polymerase sigma-70 factor (ECF subfamily) [Pelomonas saccharophila]|uniref:RNA polymerase sigma-70 factor (ECF subfamily) n=1 Tax=Roseateles saccharophilus TaxID=304 RepID=A0ABU1YJ85_ROSSA|nr:RNA polymerase sigma factor [Roseateles saccharophilus]MDR7268266.1 RNA polymerase sigma-70 factor (ECF subfamily) [Roseateles saccharophilus]
MTSGVPAAPTEAALQEARLVSRAAAGDRTAFAALVQAHQGYLRKLLGRVCRGDQGRADDLAQEAFVRAWRALPKFRGESRFRTWLTRLAYSALSAERPALPLADDAPPELGAHSDFAPGADWRIDLDRAMAELSEAQRHALLLCYGADLSHAEAAQVLGWPLGTVKTQVLRAKAKLREQLQAWENTP